MPGSNIPFSVEQQRIVDQIDQLSDRDRAQVFAELQGWYCMNCGRLDPLCSCSNDE